MEFKDIIKQRRNELNMTMEELAKLIGVSTPTIQRYESGEIENVRRDKIKLLADALQCSPAVLMGWENPDDAVSSIINKRIEETGMSLEEVAKKSGASLYWLQNIDTFIPGEFGYGDEMGYTWITRVAEVLGLPGSTLRAALARQEIPAYDGPHGNTLEQAREDFKEPINDNSIHQFISKVEQKLIDKYRSIDEKGKHTINTILEMEYNRCKASSDKLNAAHEIKGATEEEKQHDENIMNDDEFWK